MIENRIADHKSGIVIIVSLFFVLLLPLLAQVSTYHGDEHFYTDSAVYMLAHDDYLNPRYSNGTLRAKKPIVTYWVLMASYALLGVNFFAARLPFLLAGAATVWVTYKFAGMLFRQRRIATLAAALTACNIQIIMLSLRSTPDILQILFMMLSLYGFWALAFEKDCRLRNYLLTYLGVALAIQTKGLLGVVLIGFMLLQILIAREKTAMLKRILHWPVITMALVIAAWWYLYIYYQHGAEAVWQFYNDQVSSKLVGAKLYILMNIKEYAWGLLRNFAPWSLIVLPGYLAAPGEIHRFVGKRKQQIVFILSWFILLLAIFSISTDNRTRYLAPAYPLLCILIAALFVEIFTKHSIMQRIWGWSCGLFLILMGSLGVVLIWIGFVLHWQPMLGGAILLCVAACITSRVIRRRQSPAPVVMGIVLLIAVADLLGLVLPPFELAPVKSLTACLLPDVKSGRITSVWSGRRADHLRQLYTASHGRIRVSYYPRGEVPQDLDRSAVIVVTHAESEAFRAQGYSVRLCGAVFQDPDLQILWRGLLAGDKDMVNEAIQEPLYLARPKSPTY